MLDITEQITASLKNVNVYPWFPHLTEQLIGVNWRALKRDMGLTLLNYGTARFLAADTNAPRNVVTSLVTHIDAKDFKATVPIELLPIDIARQYEVMDISFYTVEGITGTNVLRCLEDALAILKRVPTLLTTVAALVRSLHVIRPESDDCDVSFSDPHIPFSVFISVPQVCNHINHLRVAEAIVHEAMHLQLTFIEKIVPIVLASTGKYFSPWKREHRTPQGILHALYVFRVVDEFLKIMLSLPRCTSEEASYIRERRTEIAEEINQVQTFIDCPDLTQLGYSFVRRLIFN